MSMCAAATRSPRVSIRYLTEDDDGYILDPCRGREWRDDRDSPWKTGM